MSDRKNFGYGLLVTDTHLDEAFDDLENAIRDLSDDTNLAQAATTDSPDSNIYGGILSGLTITRNGTNDYITIAAGVAYDDSGRRIQLPSAATLKITKTGATTEGDVTDALGDGSLVTASVGSSQYAVMSIFIVYDESQSDQKTDGLGFPYYFDEDESFHFYIKIGTAFTLPLGGAPTRGALENGKVLLADLVVYNNAGSMQVQQDGGVDAVLYSNENFDDYATGLGDANIATLTGRRSDWLALDNATDLPLFDAQSTELRANSAREALRDTWMMLQASASQPAGGDLIGVAAHSGVSGSTIKAPATTSLAAGSLHSKLNLICAYLADCLYKGGNNVITSASDADGALRVYSQYDTNQMYMDRYEYISGNPAFYRGNYGETIVGKRIEEHWMYAGSFGTPPEGVWDEHADCTGAGSSTIFSNGVALTTTTSSGASLEKKGIELGASGSNYMWDIGTGNKYGSSNVTISFPILCIDLEFNAHANGLPSTTAQCNFGLYKDTNNYIDIVILLIGSPYIELTLKGGGTSETETLVASFDITKRYQLHIGGYPQGLYDGVRGFAIEINESTATMTKQTTVATSTDISLASGGYAFKMLNQAQESSGTTKGFYTTCHYLYLAETCRKKLANA